MKVLLLLLGNRMVATLFRRQTGLDESDDELVIVPVVEHCDRDGAGLLAVLPRPDGVADVYAAILISGSSCMVTDCAPWSEQLAGWLREVVALDRTPVLGVCYGHQLLAHALGGKVRFNPAGRGLGTVAVAVDEHAVADDAVFSVFAQRPEVFMYASHVQHVCRLPFNAVRLARSAIDDNYAFRAGKWTYGTQFHPEFTSELVQNIITMRESALALEGRGDAVESLARVRHSPHGSELLRRFVDVARQKWHAEHGPVRSRL